MNTRSTFKRAIYWEVVITMCWIAATTWANTGFAAASLRAPLLLMRSASSPSAAHSITRWTFCKESITSYRRMTFGWFSLSIHDISRDSIFRARSSSLVLSMIFMATFSACKRGKKHKQPKFTHHFMGLTCSCSRDNCPYTHIHTVLISVPLMVEVSICKSISRELGPYIVHLYAHHCIQEIDPWT